MIQRNVSLKHWSVGATPPASPERNTISSRRTDSWGELVLICARVVYFLLGMCVAQPVMNHIFRFGTLLKHTNLSLMC